MATSFRPNNAQNQLFTKGRHSSIKFVLALVISLSLMIADFHYQSIGNVRHGFSVVAAPLQFIVDYPARFFEWVNSLLSSKSSLVNENIRLRYEQTMLEAKLQKYLALRHENSQLKALLSTSKSANARTMAAQILTVETNNSRQIFILDKGTRDGVFVGQPVLDAKGVMGQIIDAGLMTSTVLLISDAKSAVPVRNTRTGEYSILVGTSYIDKLSLINLPKSSTIRAGDLLVTSGLGRRYPEGYPVGQVQSVSVSPGDEFIKVAVSPIALLNRSRLILLIWPEEGYNLLTAQINERLRVLEGLV